MPHAISGRLRWDTTHAATPCWLLFLDGETSDAPRMLSVYDTSTPQDTSPDAFARLVGAMLQRETGHPPREVRRMPVEEGTGYHFVALCEDPA